jgi:multiple sugar transport system permease protein
MTDFWQRRTFKEAVSAYSFMLPTIIIIGTFLILPLGYAVFLAFHRVQILGEISYQFIGFNNFRRLASDERGWIALKNTIEYVVIVVPIQTSLALILALMLNSQIRGQNWFRVILFLPTVTSSAVLTLIFMWIYNSNGLLNNLLHGIGLPTFNWIGDPAVALKAIMLMNIWSTAPFFMTIYLAAMQDIPLHLYEAATIDGANKFEQFMFITLPWLKPVTFFVLVMGIIGTFQLFDQSYIFSAGSGGPNNSTLTIVLLIYQYVFESLDLGYAAAIAMILAIVIILFTSIQRRFFQDDRLD